MKILVFNKMACNEQGFVQVVNSFSVCPQPLLNLSIKVHCLFYCLALLATLELKLILCRVTSVSPAVANTAVVRSFLFVL